MEPKEYIDTLQDLVSKKLEWFNSSVMEEMVNQYRLMDTCVKNLYELLVRRSVIMADPYRLDKRIVDIEIPESSPFNEQEMALIFGARLSDYETMLDYICTYFRFSVENINLATIKKLVSFNNYFDWKEVSTNSNKVNTKALALCIEAAKQGGDNVLCSSITDSVTKCNQSTQTINKDLSDLTIFQRELYKYELRKDLFQHPDFRIQKAFESEENEYAEIRRLYPKVMGKKPFYSDLINEIVKEDQAPDKEKRQKAVIDKLTIKGATVETKKEKKKQGPDSRVLLMSAVASLGIVGPIIGQLRLKMAENFDILFTKQKSFMNSLKEFFKKMFGIRDKNRVVELPIKDVTTGAEKIQKIDVNEFIYELVKKEHIYSGIGTKGAEYQRIASSSDEATLNFLNTQISELQATYNTIRSLDAFFKNEVDIMLRPRLRGVQMELGTFRTSIINVNKKRGEYVSYKEEVAQMKKLGISDDYE